MGLLYPFTYTSVTKQQGERHGLHHMQQFCAASNVIMMPCYQFFIFMLEFNDLDLHITQWKFILSG